ncbi:hypothetical protein ACUIAJ_03915 [Dermabacteraceae bacterium CCM 9519]
MSVTQTPLKNRKMMSGSLYLGETGSGREAGIDATKVELKTSNATGETFNYLTGSAQKDGGEEEDTLTGEVVQDYTPEGFLKWTWDHHGETMPFEFIPNKENGKLKFTGHVTITRLSVGGDVNKPNPASFDWECVGKTSLEVIED